jgi:hypothetical protein
MSLRTLATACGLFASGSAIASPGCDALNGSKGPNFVNTGNDAGVGFSAGDTITGRIAVHNSAPNIGLLNTTSFVQLVNNGSGFTYVVPANTGDSFAISSGLGPFDRIEWSCVNAPVGGKAGSQLIDQMRQTLSRLAAQTSAQSTGESVTSAITDAFSGGGATQATNGRISTSFAAIENAANKTDADDARGAYAVLGYNKAGGSKTITKAPPGPVIYQSPWHVWVDARYTANDDKRVSSFDGRQTNVNGGISYRFNDYFLAGLVTGYENFDYDLGFRNAKLDGNGWNAGGYFGWRMWQGLRLDGMLTYGRVNYGAQADAVTAGFDADRITSMVRLSGRYGLAAGWYVEPSARVIYAHEKQDAFTDTAGVVHSKYSFDVGLASFGGEVGAPTVWSNWIVTPTVGLYGDYRFGDDTAQTVATLPNLDDGWSARVTGGLKWTATNGFSTAIGADYGGLGSDTRYWRAKGSLGLKF